DHRHPPVRHRRRSRPHPRAHRRAGAAHPRLAGRAAHHHRLHRRRVAAARGGPADPAGGGVGHPRAQEVQAGLQRVRRGAHGGQDRRPRGGGGGRAAALGDRGAVLRGGARHAPRHRPRRARRRSHDAAGRRLQAAQLALRLPGARRDGAANACRSARGDWASGGHGGDGHAPGGAGGRVRGRAPDRRPQHAELRPSLRSGPRAAPGAAQARPFRDGGGAADGGRVHHGAGEPRRDPVRAGDPHLRDGHPQHAGRGGDPRAQARDAPPGAGGPEPRRRPRGAGGPPRLRGHRGRRGRPDRGGASHPRDGALRRRPVAHAQLLLTADGGPSALRRGRRARAAPAGGGGRV
ncbi:MAG: 2-keto-3-deoxy-D-arabino-heptulosonate-7-phosphate synthase I beta, partial [uncultured Gemmatimonadetes bacterium]